MELVLQTYKLLFPPKYSPVLYVHVPMYIYGICTATAWPPALKCLLVTPIMSLRLFTGAQILTHSLFSDLSLLRMKRSTCLYGSLKDRLRQIYRELHSQQTFRSLCLRYESLKKQSFLLCHVSFRQPLAFRETFESLTFI